MSTPEICAAYEEVLAEYDRLEKVRDGGTRPTRASYADALEREAELGSHAIGLLHKIAQAFIDGTDSDGWDIGIMEEVATLLTAAGFDIEIKNEPCVACGRDDLPLHVNYQCPECYTPEEEGND